MRSRAKRYVAASLLLSLLFSVPSTAAEPRSALSGIFSNVTLSPETGDLGGLEIEIHPEAPQPYALIVFCEGWCNQAYRVPISLEGKRFGLGFSEQLFDSSGKPADEARYRVAGRLVDRSLVVDLQMNSYRSRFGLERRKMRFGLDVAAPAKPVGASAGPARPRP